MAAWEDMAPAHRVRELAVRLKVQGARRRSLWTGAIHAERRRAALHPCDPALNANLGIEHQTSPLSNQRIYGIPSLQLNTAQVTRWLLAGFPDPGTTLSFEFRNSRQTTNSPFTILSPALELGFPIQLPAATARRLRARFQSAISAHCTAITRRFPTSRSRTRQSPLSARLKISSWDLVGASEEARGEEQSLQFANQTLDNARKQLRLEAIPALDVMKAEAEVSKRDRILTVARTTLQLQESLMKNAPHEESRRSDFWKKCR